MTPRSVAYRQGVEAAKNGWDRVSPYRGLKSEAQWYLGYDSVAQSCVQ